MASLQRDVEEEACCVQVRNQACKSQGNLCRLLGFKREWEADPFVTPNWISLCRYLKSGSEREHTPLTCVHELTSVRLTPSTDAAAVEIVALPARSRP